MVKLKILIIQILALFENLVDFNSGKTIDTAMPKRAEFENLVDFNSGKTVKERNN